MQPIRGCQHLLNTTRSLDTERFTRHTGLVGQFIILRYKTNNNNNNHSICGFVNTRERNSAWNRLTVRTGLVPGETCIQFHSL